MTVAAATKIADDRPDAEELVRRASALVPMLRERADEVEKNRSVPPDIIQSFKDAGFFRILQPARWGGYEMNPVVFMRVLSELGRGCCSSAWNMMILGVHNWEFGLMDARAGEDVWGEDDSVVIASSYPPAGTLTEVEGGYVLNGRWPTSSGCDHGQWAFIGALKKTAEGQPVDRLALLVPRSDYEIIDDWHVFGLAGTGSKSLLLKDVFVPAHRAHSMLDYRLTDRGDMYLFPFNMIFYSSVSSVILGFAQGAVDIFIEQMKVRRDTGTGQLSALSPYVKDRLANAVAKIRSSRARLEQMMAQTTPKVQRRELIPLEERMHYMLDSARVGREAEEAVLLLFKAFSARGIYLTNPMQRILRDTLAGANHITQDADNNAGWLGGLLLGQEPPPLLYNRPQPAL
jgi:3-hydroxy-9,10-secoandrosta-1,3,5(10)-triene-9,17-dione monooxygenase